ncbi:unnamed protein product [Prunus armeniaca]|uniref:Uncharacterized protein n=1 Tax=Prunus armeniaca TaxID=36596 RepID=A0A6J5VPA1_PRUAR|nr:unnamed protein product [Prunus armeniaca]
MALALCNCLEKMVIGPKTNFGLPSNSLNILSDSNNSRICNLDIGFWVLNFEGLPMVETATVKEIVLTVELKTNLLGFIFTLMPSGGSI